MRRYLVSTVAGATCQSMTRNRVNRGADRLTLRLLGGPTTAEVARALLVAEPIMAKRLVRDKHKIKAAHIIIECRRRQNCPNGSDRPWPLATGLRSRGGRERRAMRTIPWRPRVDRGVPGGLRSC